MFVSTRTIATPAGDYEEPEPAKPAGQLLAIDVKVTGQPLDPGHIGRIIKPRELVDSIEVTPLSRAEMILYNQLLAHAWNDIRDRPVHKILKAALRGSHDSNDRLEDAFDTLMTAYAKVRARDPKTGKMATYRLNLLGSNKEEDAKDGYFHYTFPPDLLAIIGESTTWAAIKSNIMYALRSKYSIRLYEMIERRIGLSKHYEEFAVDTFKAMIGVPESRLERFADFNKYCLKPALEEVNHLTDFHVEVSTIKKGRAVEKLFMTWLKKRPDEMHRAHEEREKSRIGRRARWGSKVERVIFNEPA